MSNGAGDDRRPQINGEDFPAVAQSIQESRDVRALKERRLVIDSRWRVKGMETARGEVAIRMS